MIYQIPKFWELLGASGSCVTCSPLGLCPGPTAPPPNPLLKSTFPKKSLNMSLTELSFTNSWCFFLGSDIARPFERLAYQFGHPNFGAQKSLFQVFFFQLHFNKSMLKIYENTTNWDSHSFWNYMQIIFCCQNTARLFLKLRAQVCSDRDMGMVNQSNNQTYIFQIMKATVFNQKLQAMI